MDSGDTAHLTLMKRPDLGVTLTKLHCWTLTHYSKCVFMDADTMVRNYGANRLFRKSEFCRWSRCQQHAFENAQVLSNVDELFEREELSAAPDPGWPDCFNSGVFVFRPSNETHEKLLEFCNETGSFDGETGTFLWASYEEKGTEILNFKGDKCRRWGVTFRFTRLSVSCKVMKSQV